MARDADQRSAAGRTPGGNQLTAGKGKGDFKEGGGLGVDEDGGGASFDEWLEVLLRCGEMRYAEVRCGPPPVARVLPVQWATCIVEHVLKVRDEAEAIQEAVFIHCPRMPLSKIAPRVGEVPEEYSLWLRLWIQIDLKGVHHFPSWEQEVEEIMHEHFVQLHEIFSHYCKANWTPEDAEEAATLDDEEWQLLLDDCFELATPDLSLIHISEPTRP